MAPIKSTEKSVMEQCKSFAAWCESLTPRPDILGMSAEGIEFYVIIEEFLEGIDDMEGAATKGDEIGTTMAGIIFAAPDMDEDNIPGPKVSKVIDGVERLLQGVRDEIAKTNDTLEEDDEERSSVERERLLRKTWEAFLKAILNSLKDVDS